MSEHYLWIIQRLTDLVTLCQNIQLAKSDEHADNFKRQLYDLSDEYRQKFGRSLVRDLKNLRADIDWIVTEL